MTSGTTTPEAHRHRFPGNQGAEERQTGRVAGGTSGQEDLVLRQGADLGVLRHLVHPQNQQNLFFSETVVSHGTWQGDPESGGYESSLSGSKDRTFQE